MHLYKYTMFILHMLLHSFHFSLLLFNAIFRWAVSPRATEVKEMKSECQRTCPKAEKGMTFIKKQST